MRPPPRAANPSFIDLHFSTQRGDLNSYGNGSSRFSKRGRHSLLAMEDVMDICTFLSATSLFSALEPATVQRLAACCRMETYPEGATLFVAGDPGDEMFAVVSGSVPSKLATKHWLLHALAKAAPADVWLRKQRRSKR